MFIQTSIDSDIDIAILPRRPAGMSLEDRLAVTAELARIFARPVDLGVLSTANVVYAKEAVIAGQILCERDHQVTARFAMLALSMYASLQERRGRRFSVPMPPDDILLNKATSNMAMHVVAERHLGVPQSTADAFVLLERAGLIGGPLAAALCGMVGFRNVAVHQYEDIDMGVLRWIVESGHHDWVRLGAALGVSIRP